MIINELKHPKSTDFGTHNNWLMRIKNILLRYTYFDEGGLGFGSVYRKSHKLETSERYFDLTSQKKLGYKTKYPANGIIKHWRGDWKGA